MRALERPALRCLVPLGLLLLVAACKSAPTAAHEEPAHESAAPANSNSDAQREVANAQDKLAIAKLQLDLAEKRAASSQTHKKAELDLARAELTQFDENDAPSQLAKSKLELTRHRDSMAEQQEELAQLEMLYEKQDLADKTREIVLQRGKRRSDRAAEDLAIAERDAATLETKSLPHQRAKLALEVAGKERELEESSLESQATLLERRMAVRAAEADLQAAQSKAGSAGAKP